MKYSGLLDKKTERLYNIFIEEKGVDVHEIASALAGDKRMTMELNKGLFYQIVYDMTMDDHERYNIGTYKEKKLHRILKYYFEPDTDNHEVPYQGFIADIKKEDQIIEIETSGFTGLREKLNVFLQDCQVTLVYPMAASRSISWIDPETGQISAKRRSPKKANAYDLLFECIYINEFLTSPNLHICGMELDIQEYRLLDGWSRDKKRGSHRYERIPTDVFGLITLDSPADYAVWVPDACGETFTTAQFCTEAGVNPYVGRAVMKVLQKVGVIAQVGKEGKRFLYAKIPQ